MSEQNKPFVVTDRRKFTLDGTPRPDADPSPEREARPEAAQSASTTPAASTYEAPLEFKSPHGAPESSAQPAPASSVVSPEFASDADLPPPPTTAEMEQANAAYQETSDRLDTAVRAANPGMDHPPAMSFEQILTSIYMTTIMQLGGTTQEGQQPKVDLMGARQSIDMLGILAEKTRGNLTPAEEKLMDNALFEVRMGFLEVTQALARSAATRNPAPPGAGAPGRPSIVR
jgi:Domain of unknown function (DUF1844)